MIKQLFHTLFSCVNVLNDTSANCMFRVKATASSQPCSLARSHRTARARGRGAPQSLALLIRATTER